MTPEETELIGHFLSDDMPFPYYADRESAWVLAQCMRETARVGDLRAGPFGKLLDRPALRPLVARCGGTLRRADVLAVAHAHRALQMPGLSPAGEAGVAAAFAGDWHDFRLSFGLWGEGRGYWDQTTRQNANLVVQLGFPSDHAALMGRYLCRDARKAFEYRCHPIRTEGRPTLAWARLDIDIETGEALIEEVQTDWLRFAREESRQGREGRAQAGLERYEAGLVARYGKIWSRAMLLAALVVLRDELGISRVWMHQPEAGVCFKRIIGTPPPRSLYTALPRSLCFEPTRVRPAFLRKLRNREVNRLPKQMPLFWRLDFT